MFSNLGIGMQYASRQPQKKKGMSGILGAITGLAGLGAGIYGQERTFKNNRSLMKMQQKFDKDMYDYQNAYNTPAMQMKRFKDAGLNPNLIYGQGTPGNATNQPKAQIAQTTFSGAELAQSAATGAQTSLIGAQEKLLRSQRIKNLQDAATGSATESRINKLVGLEAQSLEFGIKKTQAETSHIIQQEKRALEQTVGQNIDNIIKDQSKQDIIKKAAHDANNAVIDGKIKTQQEYELRLKNNLREEGITDNDNVMLRMFAQEKKSWTKWFKAAKAVGKAIWDSF